MKTETALVVAGAGVVLTVLWYLKNHAAGMIAAAPATAVNMASEAVTQLGATPPFQYAGSAAGQFLYDVLHPNYNDTANGVTATPVP